METALVPANEASLSSPASAVAYRADADSEARSMLVEFLTDAFSGGPVAKVVLCQVGPNGDQRVADWERFEGLGPDHIVEQVLERARDDAKPQRGAPRYMVLYYRDATRAYDGRKGFTLPGGAVFDAVEDAEGPNGQGLIAQMMRHNESVMRLGLMHTNEMMASQRREIQDARSMLRHALQMHFKVVETHEAMINEKHRRDMELERSEHSQKQKDQLFEKIISLAPLVLMKLAPAMTGGAGGLMGMTAGGPMGTAAGGMAGVSNAGQAPAQGAEAAPGIDSESRALAHQLRALVGSLDQSQLPQLMAMLNDDQKRAFVELYKQLAKAQAEEAASAPPSGGSA